MEAGKQYQTNLMIKQIQDCSNNQQITQHKHRTGQIIVTAHDNPSELTKKVSSAAHVHSHQQKSNEHDYVLKPNWTCKNTSEWIILSRIQENPLHATIFWPD
jgi:hypothetical protein